MKKYLTKTNISLFCLVAIPLVIFVGGGVYFSIGDGGDDCLLCTPTPTVIVTPGVTPTPTPTPTPSGPPPTEFNPFLFCAPGCGNLLIGDGVCNVACNVWDCNYDGGDCDGCEGMDLSRKTVIICP